MHVVQLGVGDRVSAGEGQRRMARQRRVATCRVVVGREVGKSPLKITGIPVVVNAQASPILALKRAPVSNR